MHSWRMPRPHRSTEQFAVGVRGGVFTTCTPSSASTASNDAAQFGVAVADHEPEVAGLFAEVHQQVAGLLSHPRLGRVVGHAKQMHPSGGDLHDDQHVQTA